MNRFTLKMLFRSIRSSLGRYLAILAIVALGVGFYSGLKSSRPALLRSAEDYFRASQLQDFQLLSSLGFTEEDVEAFRGSEEAAAAEGAFFADAVATVDGKAEAWHFLSLTQSVSVPVLTAGRMPEKSDECLGDDRVFTEADIGKTIIISTENDEDVSDLFSSRSYTVTGLARSPRWLSADRGSTSLLSGSIHGFVILLPEGFSSEIFHELLVWCDLPGALYSEEYSAARDQAEKGLRTLLSRRGRIRRSSLVQEAEKALAEAQSEIDDGWEELREGEATAAKELADAQAKLDEAEQEIRSGWTQVNSSMQQLEDGMASIPAARDQIASGRAELEAGRAELEANAEQVALYRRLYNEVAGQLTEHEAELLALLQETDTARYQALAPYYENVAALQAEVLILNAMIASDQTDPADLPALQERLQSAEADLAAAQAELAEQEAAYVPDDSAVMSAEEILASLYETAADLDAQLSDAEAQLQAGQAQLAAAEAELNAAEAQLDQAEQDYPGNLAQINAAAWQLKQGEKELEEGRAEMEKAAAEAEAELQEGRDKLNDAQRELDEKSIEVYRSLSLELYCLDRSTNAGYVSYETDTDIIEAVSYAFPVFFVLIAALVCTTTMTRMVREERTVIGTMKAMGYRGGAVMGKYLLYSGSSALIGCVCGYFLGTRAIPSIVWMAYHILYNLSEPAFSFDPRMYSLCLAVSLPGILLVTWASCRRELSEKPADLIRPKAPPVGRRILLEYIRPLWRRLSFLDKITLRNAFRYKQRVFMMLLGIGGCTALLVAGFGLRDSLTNVAALQYGEVALYDLSVTLDSDELSAEEAAEHWAGETDAFALTVQEPVTLRGAEKEMGTRLVAAEEAELPGILDLHDGDRPLPWPAEGEALITKKLADRLSLSTGDTAEIEREDGEILTVKIAGVCENYLNHYVYVSREAVADTPRNTVLLKAGEQTDPSLLAASLRAVEGVTYVSLTSYERELFEQSMSSLDLVVALIVVCSGGLAFITLYNLTNINIMERSREVATVKVLGFTPAETGAYILRENLLLSVLGALLGLLLGKVLHAFIMNLVDLEAVTYQIRVNLLSYLISFAVTLLFSLGTNLVMRRKLEKVDMAESLKSVE